MMHAWKAVKGIWPYSGIQKGGQMGNLVYFLWNGRAVHIAILNYVKRKLKKIMKKLSRRGPQNCEHNEYKLKSLEETVQSMKNTSENTLVNNTKIIDVVLNVVKSNILGHLDEVAKVNNEVKEETDNKVSDKKMKNASKRNVQRSVCKQ